VHQLRQREFAVLLQQAHFQARAARVRQRANRVADHHVHGKNSKYKRMAMCHLYTVRLFHTLANVSFSSLFYWLEQQ
jgi:hypothetical protein